MPTGDMRDVSDFMKARVDAKSSAMLEETYREIDTFTGQTGTEYTREAEARHEFKVDGKKVGENEECYIIAEIGHNHMGNMVLAKRLIKAAKEAGASAVKFQKRNIATLTTEEFGKSPTRDQPWSFGDTYLEHRAALELDGPQYSDLRDYASEVGITMFATAFDPESVGFLEDYLEPPAYKMASGDITNTPLLEHVAKLGKPMFVSTGGSSLDDVKRAVEVISKHNNDFALLQCSSTYPTPPKDINLRVIEAYRMEFPRRIIGLSHHCPGITVSLAAYAMGARVIEQHFTLDRYWRGTDQRFSIEPYELESLREATREVRVALGDGVKEVRVSEWPGIDKNAKSLYWAHALPEGHQVRAVDIVSRAPGGKTAPWQMREVLGQRLMLPVNKDQAVGQSNFEYVDD